MNNIYKLLIYCLPLFLWSAEIKQTKEQALRLNFLGGAPKFLHPHLISDTNGFVLCQALLEGITRLNFEGKVELAIAKKIELSKCKTKYTIYLHPAVWSNGKELTAYHFAKAWKSAIAPNTKCTRTSRFFIIKNSKKVFQGKLPMEEIGIYAIKKDQLVVHLEHPAAYFTKLLASPTFSPLFDTSERKITVFNGPFILETFRPGKSIKLKKNMLYWDHKEVKLDGVEISLIQDAMTAYKMFQKGLLDYIGSPISDLPEEVMQNSKHLKITETHAPCWVYLNFKDPKLHSKKIRKALDLAVNREHIANFILPNASPNDSPLPKGLSSLKSNFKQWAIKDIQKLFDEGLKELNYKKQDYTIEISSSNVPRHTKVADYLKYCWEKIFDIHVTLKKSDWATYHSNLCSHNFTVGGDVRYATYEDPLYFLEYFLFADGNNSNWENLKFQKWIDLANKTTSDRKRKKYLAKAEGILNEEVPIIPIYTHKHLYLCNPSLRNFRPSKLVYLNFRWAYFVNQ